MGKSFYIIRHIIMKAFIVLAASAIALASGLCLEDDEVVAMCTVGTDIGSKLEAAAAACENGPAAGRSRKQEREKARVRVRVRDKRSAPLLRRSGKRCRRRWEMSCVSSSRLAGWMRAMSLTMPLLWLTLPACLRRFPWLLMRMTWESVWSQ